MFKEYCPHPVLVIVDVRPECEEIPTQAYVTVETVLEVRLPRVVPYALASRLGVWLAGMADGLYRRAHRQHSHVVATRDWLSPVLSRGGQSSGGCRAGSCIPLGNDGLDRRDGFFRAARSGVTLARRRIRPIAIERVSVWYTK